MGSLSSLPVKMIPIMNYFYSILQILPLYDMIYKRSDFYEKAISILLFIFFVLSFSACSSTDYSLTASNSESKAQSSLYWDDDYSYSQVDTDIEEQTEEPTKNPIDVEIEYKASCSTIDFKTLSRNPDKYIGNRYTFTGEVIQVMEESSSNTVHLRLDITKTSYGYSDTIYVVGELDNSGDRILEDDIITIWGDWWLVFL